MEYTVKQVASMSGVSERTLRYYDKIDLLHPAHVGTNGYRYYDQTSLLRLQQILFFRELGFRLNEIKAILDQPDFDVLQALATHRAALQRRLYHLHDLLRTIDRTIDYLQGEHSMKDEALFEGFSPEKQAEYEQEMRDKYGSETVDESVRRWNNYSPEERDTIKAQGEAVFRAMRDAINEGHTSPAAQTQVRALQQHIGHFYECTLEILRGLGEVYVSHPDFVATFERIHPDLPNFLHAAIDYYCDQHTE
ncbi:MAG: MerR family transcriptional regulator [Chloroflexi bacterium]|nr:MerR family transcriptional regulator [Chloroflexota bacterium]